MAYGKLNRLSYFIFIVLSLVSSCFASSLIDHHLPYNNFQQENGHDFRAYLLSYFGYVKFDDALDKKNVFGVFDDLKKYRRILAASGKTIDVLNHGAKGDGTSDDTKAFEQAWREACSSSGNVVIMVPGNKNYLLKPIRFSGPCKSGITMQIAGTIVASSDRSDYGKDGRLWILFEQVQNLQVVGGGIINGNGKIWWQNSCKINKAMPCTSAPTALSFYKCTNLVVKNLKIENAQQIHVTIDQSKDVQVSDLKVTAPGNSPNTDGIHIGNTQNIQILNSVIGTGDDCISIVSGSQKVRAQDITCGPGHGISIGSLGSQNSEAYVSDVVVDGAKLFGTTNGVRIKTWQGGSGSASNIKFRNIVMENVKNPIIIDQHYCDRQDKNCQEQASAVQVKDVLYQNIKGTSATDKAIIFNCSSNHPCQGIVMQNVNLALENGAGNSKAICNHVNFQNSATFSPRCIKV